MEPKELLSPTIVHHGPAATHNMPCAVCRVRPAVYYINRDVFMPCWSCRQDGWELVRPESWWKKLLCGWPIGVVYKHCDLPSAARKQVRP